MVTGVKISCKMLENIDAVSGFHQDYIVSLEKSVGFVARKEFFERVGFGGDGGSFRGFGRVMEGFAIGERQFSKAHKCKEADNNLGNK